MSSEFHIFNQFLLYQRLSISRAVIVNHASSRQLRSPAIMTYIF